MSGRRRAAPLSIRLSDAERASLETRAGDLGLSTYVKSVLFGPEETNHRVVRQPRFDERLLAELLGRLGQSELSSSLKIMARHAQTGTLYCDDALRDELRRACQEIYAIRTLLVEALCRPVRSPADSARAEFNHAAEKQP